MIDYTQISIKEAFMLRNMLNKYESLIRKKVLEFKHNAKVYENAPIGKKCFVQLYADIKYDVYYSYLHLMFGVDFKLKSNCELHLPQDEKLLLLTKWGKDYNWKRQAASSYDYVSKWEYKTVSDVIRVKTKLCVYGAQVEGCSFKKKTMELDISRYSCDL